MKTSRVLLASIFLTAVILAVVSGFASSVMAQKQAEAASAANAEAVPTEAAPAEVLAVYQEREAAYQQTIEQANQQLTALQSRLAQLENPQAQAAAAPAAQVSAEQALKAAREAAGIAMKESKAPELVSFEGKAAYEVVFEAGSIYIDAQSGNVLFNGTVPQQITAEQAAKIASDYLGIKDILTVDQITFRGSPLWRVIFKNSTMVYMDLTGQITYILKDSNKPQTIDVSGGGGGGGDFFGGSSEPHDEHEGEHEDD